jgi:D-glycero-alpha-D-manno-heptose-7-phosphate kinase
MIHSRTPLRVSFVGGGTDLPSFYRRHGGAVVSSAVVHYIDVMVKPLPPGSKYRYQLNGSDIQEAADIDEIESPITRAALEFTNVNMPLEIISHSSVPAGTGLGSSSSFTVGLLNALHALKGECRPAEELAEEACHLEIELLKAPIGRQDQYIASIGGLRHTVFHQDERIVSESVCRPGTREKLEKHLLLFYLGGNRDAVSILSRVNNDMEQKTAVLQEMKGLCGNFLEVLERGTRLEELGEILDITWRLKCQLNDGISNEFIDDMYQRSRAKGAIGGKLLGAGGAGFLLLFVPLDQQDKVRAELREYREFQYKCDLHGSQITQH